MKKILLILLLSLFIIPNVKADTNYETVVLDKYEEVTTEIITSNISSKPFKNYGSGHLIFSFATYSNNSLLPLIGVYADTSTQSFTCNIGNFSAFDNGYQYFSGYSVDCPVNFGESGLTGIIFEFPGVEISQRIQTSYNMTFVSNDSDDLGQLLSVVNQLYTDMGYGFSRQYIQLGEIYDRIGYGFSQSNELNQQILDALTESDKTINDIKDGVNDLNENITSSDTSTSQGNANSFFEGFESDDYGLSDIVTMPLDLIKGLTSNTCVALSLTIPFVNKTFQLPCMSSIYQEYFGSFFTIYQTITFGFIAYWVIVKIFALVKGFKDPDDDKVEVLDL